DPATKADLAALPNELRQLNAAASILDKRDIELPNLFTPRNYMAVEQSEDVAGWLALDSVIAAETNGHEQGRNFDVKRHGAGINTFSITYDDPIPEKSFHSFLGVLQSAAGPRLLRAKGIVSIAEKPGKPQIIHVVQHLASRPVELETWPDDDHRTRFVFITNGIDPGPIEDVFDAVINGAERSFKDIIFGLSRTFLSAFPTNLNRNSNAARKSAG
ncbi:MAG: GTP-binding protein, partial [Pseudomonadota bacterium]